MEGVRLRELLILCTACLCCEVPRQTLGGVSLSSCGSQFLVKKSPRGSHKFYSLNTDTGASPEYLGGGGREKKKQLRIYLKTGRDTKKMTAKIPA